MQTETITLKVPEVIYQRLANTARGMQRPLEEIVIHALKVGIPPLSFRISYTLLLFAKLHAFSIHFLSTTNVSSDFNNFLI